MKRPNLFFAAVLIGALGIATLLSPAPAAIGLWIIAFATELIRAGLVLVNVEVRKVNHTQYGVVLTAAIIATLGIAAAIDQHLARYSMEWWAGQTINFVVLAGEYSWAVILAGAPVDWEFEAMQAKSNASRLSEELAKAKQALAAAQQAEAEAKEEARKASEALEDAQCKADDLGSLVSDLQGDLRLQDMDARINQAILDSWLAARGRKISVDSVKANVCECGRLTINASNKHIKKACECGRKLS